MRERRPQGGRDQTIRSTAGGRRGIGLLVCVLVLMLALQFLLPRWAARPLLLIAVLGLVWLRGRGASWACDHHGLICHHPWRPPRVIPWAAVRDVAVGPRGARVATTQGIVLLPQSVEGFEELVATIQRRAHQPTDHLPLPQPQPVEESSPRSWRP